MKLKGKKVVSRASGIEGIITEISKNGIRVSFTKYQDIMIPSARIDSLLIMDEETKMQLHHILDAANTKDGEK